MDQADLEIKEWLFEQLTKIFADWEVSPSNRVLIWTILHFSAVHKRWFEIPTDTREAWIAEALAEMEVTRGVVPLSVCELIYLSDNGLFE